MLLVCEEAHRYVPQRAERRWLVGRPAILERIAKEGRKYGISLGLITQRPSDLAEGVLSQCGTIIAMRLNNDRDQAFVEGGHAGRARACSSDPGAAQPRMHHLRRGRADPDARRLRRFLAEELRPSSSDPVFSTAWNGPQEDSDVVGRVIARWRNQGHEPD